MNRIKARLMSSNLFVPGYCDNPDDDAPILNIRQFEHAGAPVALAFTSLPLMRRFFSQSGLQSLKYMEITAPDHIEAICALERDLIVNSHSRSEAFLPLAELRDVLAEKLALN